MTKDEALKLALEALKKVYDNVSFYGEVREAIAAIKEALAQPEQEPVAWMRQDGQRVTTASDRHNYPDYKTRYSIPLYTSPPQPEYLAVKTYHEGEPVYVAQPEQPKYRRGDRLICLETEDYCVIHISGPDRQWVKFPDSHIGVYTNEQVAELFELLPKEQPQPEPVGRFAKFTDGIWREVTDGSAGVPLYTTPPQQEQNFNCKSVQARLATAWGYTKVQSQQEPVAWIHNFIDGGITFGKRPADLERHPDRWTALFKDPKPCPTCEALARTVMLDQTSHDAAPPQRTWVGLTVKEIYAMYQNTRWSYKDQLYFALEIEAKLKEKNEH